MTGGQPRFETGIESSEAILPGPPPLWSFSSLKEAGACQRRYALARASYPDLWDGRGYPRVPALAALFGVVVHGALDTIVKALVAAGCESAQSRSSASSRQPSHIPTAYTLTVSRYRRHAGHPQPRPARLRDPGKGNTMPAADDRSADQARAAIEAALGQIGFTLPGSITIRRT